MTAAVENIVPSSAAPALSLLEEPEPLLQAHALRSLNSLADAFWHEISSAVDKIQELSEDYSFPERNLAAIVAAKVNFHLGSLDDALHYALSAGLLFDVDAETEFAHTVRARCIDDYILLRKKDAGEGTSPPLPSKADSEPGSSAMHSFQEELESVVERVLNGCIQKGEIHEAIGVSIEAQRLDKVKKAIYEGCRTDAAKLDALDYCFQCAQNLISSRLYRAKVLGLIAGIHIDLFPPEKRNFIAVANCYSFIGDAHGIAEILLSLVLDKNVAGKENETDLELMALQIAFDVVDNDAPFFASKILAMLPRPPTPLLASLEPDRAQGDDQESGPADASGPTPMETDEAEAEGEAAGEAEAESGAETKEGAKVEKSSSAPTNELSKEEQKLLKLRRILRGEVTGELYLDFLCSKNKSDTYLLKKIKLALDARSSVCHSALLFANAIAHSGTAIDTFVHENLDWVARATAWARFSATSCIGVIHGRHTWSALKLLSQYLPSTNVSGGSAATAYSEGGALYALGLIAATGSKDAKLSVESGQPVVARDYLLRALRAGDVSDVVKHGACLGLGLSSMAYWDGGDVENEYYEELKSVLSTDSAIASEAAGLGMGLVALGSGSARVCDEMISCARQTEHEKITRGLAMGAALVCYGREDDAMGTINTMLKDKEPILRYGAMYAIALAYCGTADNKAIRMLLYSAVSDVSDDVRRAAVISLGFVLFRHAKMLPHIVSLLAESCHAHVRYGAAMAIGVACIGTGSPMAIGMLERLTSDPSDFVRQGALIGLAMVLMHHTEERTPKSAEMRKTLESTWSAKLEDVITRFGAVVASGIMDAGGRNGAIALTSSTGHPRMSAIVGLAIFTQFWYWYPLVHFIGLCIKPAGLICLNKELHMPRLKVQCNAPEGLFAYVPVGPPEKAKEVTSAPKAVLSVTAKHNAKALRRTQKRKESENKDDDKMDVKDDSDGKGSNTGKGEKQSGPENPNIEGGKNTSVEAKNEFTILENPCRVLDDQEHYMSWNVDGQSSQRYVPVLQGRMSGIVLMRDTNPEEEEDFVELQSVNNTLTGTRQGTDNEQRSGGTEEEGEEVPVPESFIYLDEESKEEEGQDGDETMEDGGGESQAAGGENA